MTRLLALILFVFLPVQAFAQTTAGIPGPAVRADDRTVQFRSAVGIDDDRSDRVEARLHYQQGISDDLRWRIVVQGNDFETGKFEPVFLQAELQWELDENPAWAKAVRFDGRLSENDDGPDHIGLVSLNQFKLSDAMFARANLFTNYQIGGRRSDGIAADARFLLGHKAGPKTTLSLESFIGLGRGGSFGKLKRNRLNLGPGVSHKLGDGVSIYGSVLFGLNDSTSDTDLRLWLTKGF